MKKPTRDPSSLMPLLRQIEDLMEQMPPREAAVADLKIALVAARAVLDMMDAEVRIYEENGALIGLVMAETARLPSCV